MRLLEGLDSGRCVLRSDSAVASFVSVDEWGDRTGLTSGEWRSRRDWRVDREPRRLSLVTAVTGVWTEVLLLLCSVCELSAVEDRGEPMSVSATEDVRRSL
jgi:hypothetical protein